MPDALPDETRLAAEIDRLKAEIPKTRELYREVCALLFFRFGITPTANRLYQLVKRGSMGTPTQVLGEFWTELREKSRVRIERPDLPADLQAAAGELVATLWTRSTTSAQAELEALRVEVEGQRTDAEQRVAAARGELDRTETALEQRTAALLAAQVEVRELEKAQAEGHAARHALEAEITRLKNEAAVRAENWTRCGKGSRGNWKSCAEPRSAPKSASVHRKSGRCSRSITSVAPPRSCARSSTRRQSVLTGARWITAA
ncbi:uncharacterized small protein (DUF1192 family) [Paraburkholderia sp. WC7.3d]